MTLRPLALAAVLAFGAAATAEPAVRVLPNGCTLIAQREPGTGRVGAVLMVRAGDADDPAAAPGASRVVARVVMDAANHRAPGRFDATSVDGEIWSETEPDVTTFSVRTVPGQALAAVRRLALLTESPLWNNTRVMRNVAVEGAAEREEVPAAWERCFNAWQARAGLPVPPAGDTPPPERETLRALHDRLYIPNRMVLAVVGDIDASAVMAEAEAAFRPVPGEPERFQRRRPRFVSPPAQPEAREYAFSGYPAPAATEPDAPAVEVISTALGMGKTSVLFRRLRESEGTGYESGVVYPLRLGASGVALFARAPGREADVRDELAAMWKQAGSLAPAAVAAARARAAIAYAARHQTARDRAYWLCFWETAGVGAGYDTAYAERLRTVPDEAVAAAAKRWFRGDPVSVP